MAREDPLFRLRMPEDMKAALKEAADRNHRSLNAEIVSRLERTIVPEVTATGVAERQGTYDSGMQLTQEQTAALMELLNAMVREPLYHGTEYESPHAAAPDLSGKTKKAG